MDKINATVIGQTGDIHVFATTLYGSGSGKMGYCQSAQLIHIGSYVVNLNHENRETQICYTKRKHSYL